MALTYIKKHCGDYGDKMALNAIYMLTGAKTSKKREDPDDAWTPHAAKRYFKGLGSKTSPRKQQIQPQYCDAEWCKDPGEAGSAQTPASTKFSSAA